MPDIVQINNIAVFQTYDDLLAMTNPKGLAWVIDATSDPTVGRGSALYYWDGETWSKRYETEMMDRPVNRVNNIEVLKRLTEVNNKLYYAGVRISRISDVEEVVTNIAGPIINVAVANTVGPVAVEAVETAMAEVLDDINGAISSSESTLRSEYQQADTSLASTLNTNIGNTKTDILNTVVQTAETTNSISADISETRKLTMNIRRDSNANNRLSVSSAGVLVSPELPTDAANGDLAMFNGTSWVKKSPSELPSTLAWASV